MRSLLFFGALLSAWLFPAVAQAQWAFSFGTDGGITLADPRVRFLDPKARQRNTIVGPGLGIDLAGYYVPSKSIAIGLAMTPSLLTAGPEPSPGINFAFGPRLVWRAGRLHLAADAGVVLSAWEDLCQVDDPEMRRFCPLTHKSDPTATGFGFGLAPLVRVTKIEGVADLLVGPAFRYQSARYGLTDAPGSFVLSDFQAVIGVHMYLDVSEVPERSR